MTPAGASLLALLLAGCAASVPPRCAPSPVAPLPDSALPGWNDAVDFTALRTSFGERRDFWDRCQHDRPIQRLAAFVESEDWEGAARNSEGWLESCPVDIDAHMIRSLSLSSLGRSEEADVHARWYRGLVESVLDSGDGRTPETAFVVISVAEEYSVLRALRLEYGEQSLTRDRLDRFEITTGDGSTSPLYFDPSAHLRRLDRQLGVCR